MANLSTFLADLGSVTTHLIGYFGDILNEFTQEPVLAIMLGIMVTGAVIGLVKRVVNVR